MTLLVSLVCLTLSGAPTPLLITAARHLEESIEWSNAQCDHCPCWLPAPGCTIRTPGCVGPCGYFDTQQWGPFVMSDVNGCFDADLLPVPQGGWVYWVRE